MKYICSWSGGKDSTASIILAHLLGIPLDIIVFAEVMFDKNISAENPSHIDFVMNKAIPLFESWGYVVKIVRSEKTYLDAFHHVIERPSKHSKHKGKTYGFPVTGMCSVKRDLKLKPLEDFYKTIGNEPYVEYVGICIDEPKRLASMHKKPNKVSLLEKCNYTEDMARALCDKYDLLSPCYGISRRNGCWICPYAKLNEHRQVRQLYPQAWYKYVSLEKEPNLAFGKWNVFKESLEERELLLSKEDILLME